MGKLKLQDRKSEWARCSVRINKGLSLTMIIGPDGFRHEWRPAWPGSLPAAEHEVYVKALKRMRKRLLAETEWRGKSIEVRA